MQEEQGPKTTGQQPSGDETSQDEVVIGLKDPSTRRIRYRLLTLAGIVGTIGVAAGFITGTELELREARQEAVRMLGESEFKVKPAERIEAVNPIPSENLAQWQDTKRSYQQTFNEATSYNNSIKIIGPLRQLAVNHTLYGAELCNKAFGTSDFEVDYQADKLTFGSREFDLSKPKDFHLASAIVDVQISKAYWSKKADESNDQQVREDAAAESKKAEADLEDLLYVDYQINDIYFTEESSLYFSKDALVAMGRIAHALNQHGYPQPKTIMVARATDNAGSYWEHDSSNSPFTVVLRGNIWDEGVVHELGHFISDISNYDESNKEKAERASLENYQKVVEAVQLLYSNQSTDLNNQYVTDYATENIKEDYAETFAWYFWNGDDFRAKLDKIATEDPAAYQILKARYDFFKNVVFEGEEFHNKGVSVANEQKEQPMPAEQNQTEYKVGDLVEIVDEDTNQPGILLRPQLITQDWYINQEWPAVFNGDEVELIEGPQQVIEFVKKDDQYVLENGQASEEKVNWWKVRIDHQTYESYSLVGNIKGEGWVSEKWFGGKVPTP